MTTDLVAIVHQIVNCNQSFEHNHPVGILSSLNQNVGHLWHGHVRLIGALQQIWHKSVTIITVIIKQNIYELNGKLFY